MYLKRILDVHDGPEPKPQNKSDTISRPAFGRQAEVLITRPSHRFIVGVDWERWVCVLAGACGGRDELRLNFYRRVPLRCVCLQGLAATHVLAQRPVGLLLLTQAPHPGSNFLCCSQIISWWSVMATFCQLLPFPPHQLSSRLPFFLF